MPISPLKPIELIQTEIHNRVTPRDEEDRLHRELRGEEYKFTVVHNGTSQEARLSVQNIGIGDSRNVNVRLRVEDYTCPTEVDDWRDDIRFIYICEYLYNARELGSPLLSGVEIMGHNKHDIQIRFTVHSTFQSAIWESVGRFASAISLYHSDHFQEAKHLYEEYHDSDWENKEVPMGAAAGLMDDFNDWNLVQAYSYLTNYADWKIDSDSGSDRPALERK